MQPTAKHPGLRKPRLILFCSIVLTHTDKALLLKLAYSVWFFIVAHRCFPTDILCVVRFWCLISCKTAIIKKIYILCNNNAQQFSLSSVGRRDVSRAICTRLAAESGISDYTRYVNAAYYNSLFASVCSRAAGCSSTPTADRRQLVCTVCTAPETPRVLRCSCSTTWWLYYFYYKKNEQNWGVTRYITCVIIFFNERLDLDLGYLMWMFTPMKWSHCQNNTGIECISFN